MRSKKAKPTTMPTPMDFSSDEMRRRLRDTQRDHQIAQSRFAAALDEAFDPGTDIADGDKSRLLGLPDRRGFLKLGGMTVALSAIAVACVNQTKDPIQLAQTGTLAPTSSTSVAPNPGSSVTDATLVLTALSIEKLAIDTYDAALNANYLTTALLRDVAMYFRDQHRDHAGLLMATAIDLGQTSVVPTVGANAFLADEIVKPALDTIKGASNDKAKEKATLTLARELEDAAAQTYTKAGGVLTTATLRQGIMSIGAIEAKHFSVLSELVGEDEVPFAFGPTGGAAPPDAYVRPDVNAVPTTTSTFAPTAGSTPRAATPGSTG